VDVTSDVTNPHQRSVNQILTARAYLPQCIGFPDQYIVAQRVGHPRAPVTRLIWSMHLCLTIESPSPHKMTSRAEFPYTIAQLRHILTKTSFEHWLLIQKAIPYQGHFSQPPAPALPCHPLQSSTYLDSPLLRCRHEEVIDQSPPLPLITTTPLNLSECCPMFPPLTCPSLSLSHSHPPLMQLRS
jgi:hypothetical protein